MCPPTASFQENIAPAAEGGPIGLEAGLGLLELAMDEPQPFPELPPGTVIGNYQLIAKLGEGGFGVVWRAQQTAPVLREVAMKILRSAEAAPEIMARFHQEQSVLARMTHPGIATVFDAGTTEAGLPYLVMELVQGRAITRYCTDKHADFRTRIRLMLDVCRAVQHAHEKAILHRDLKPSNILVAEVDGRPVPKVIDFGISQGLAGAEAATVTRPPSTSSGVLGTPNYMAPEELGAEPVVPDVRTDVYALGVILFELITGASGAEAGRPSTKVLQRGSHNALRTQVPRHAIPELDWVTFKALEKDPANRYATVAALADDLQHLLRNEPLSVGPAGWWYPFRKLVRRNRVGFAAITVVTASVVTVICMGALNYRREVLARREADRLRLVAEAESTRANEAVEFLSGMLTDAAGQVSKGKNPEALVHALQGAAVNVGTMTSQPQLQGVLAGRLGGIYLKMDAPRESVPLLELHIQRLRDEHGGDDMRTLEAMMTLATALQNAARYADAAAQVQQVAERCEATGRAETPLAFTARLRQASLLAHVNRTKEALEIMRGLYDRPDTNGRPGRENPVFLRNYADMQVREGDYAGARATLRACLAGLSKGPKGRLLRPRIVAKLAEIELEAGNSPEALRCVEESLALSAEFADADPSGMVDLLIELARVQAGAARPDEGLGLITQALEIAARAGNRHQQLHGITARTDLLESISRWQDTLAALQQERELRDADPESPFGATAYMRTRVARCWSELGRHAEAEREALDIWSQLRTHPETLEAPGTMGRYLDRLILICERAQAAGGDPTRHAALITDWKRRLAAAQR